MESKTYLQYITNAAKFHTCYGSMVRVETLLGICCNNLQDHDKDSVIVAKGHCIRAMYILDTLTNGRVPNVVSGLK